MVEAVGNTSVYLVEGFGNQGMRSIYCLMLARALLFAVQHAVPAPEMPPFFLTRVKGTLSRLILLRYLILLTVASADGCGAPSTLYLRIMFHAEVDPRANLYPIGHDRLRKVSCFYKCATKYLSVP